MPSASITVSVPLRGSGLVNYLGLLTADRIQTVSVPLRGSGLVNGNCSISSHDTREQVSVPLRGSGLVNVLCWLAVR